MPPQKPPVCPPTALMAEMTAIKINASMTAYSTAVAASESCINRRQKAINQPMQFFRERRCSSFVLLAAPTGARNVYITSFTLTVACNLPQVKKCSLTAGRQKAARPGTRPCARIGVGCLRAIRLIGDPAPRFATGRFPHFRARKDGQATMGGQRPSPRILAPGECQNDRLG